MNNAKEVEISIEPRKIERRSARNRRTRTKEREGASVFVAPLRVISWAALAACAYLLRHTSAKDRARKKLPNAKALPPDDLLSAKQEEKLNLEIESLRKKNRWEVVAQLMPIFATLVGIAGFFLTLAEFDSRRSAEQERAIIEQQKDRMSREVDQRTRLQNQVRTDIDEILRSARDEKQTVSRVSFLLADVKTVLESPVNEKQKVSDIFPGYERTLTDSLVILVRNDCDFTRNPRDVGLANTVITRWDDYSDYLREQPASLAYILYEYTRALQHLRDQNPGYLEGLTMDAEKKGFIVSSRYDWQKEEPLRYHHFLEILDGFRMHVKILDKENLGVEARELKQKNLQYFLSVLNNPIVSDYFRATHFPDEPRANGQ